MKEQFREMRCRAASLEVIHRANEILDEYERVTARQLYYQFVARGLLDELGFRPDASGSTNNPQSYKRLTSIISDGRLAGMIDWSKIEDRGREPTVWTQYDGPADMVNQTLQHYRLPRWADQDHYVELWVEKQALAGVLEPLAYEFHVSMMVNKGYSSQSAMYASAERFREYVGEGKRPVLFYLGDFDPSGEDMVRDIRERLIMFGVEDIDVCKIALTMSQIKQYNPPPNPAKITDPRAKDYIRRNGESSWEVDALNPRILSALIRDAFRTVVDEKKMKEMKKKEEIHKQKLRDMVRRMEEELTED